MTYSKFISENMNPNLWHEKNSIRALAPKCQKVSQELTIWEKSSESTIWKNILEMLYS